MRIILAVLFVVFVVTGPAAQAAIIWDYSPATGGTVTADTYTNNSSGQNFAEQIVFAGNTSVTAMDIYMGTSLANLGDIGLVRFWSDVSGAPTVLLASFAETVTTIDSVGATASNHRVHVNFTSPLALTGGTTYWIGMSSGTSNVLWGQTGLSGVNDSVMALFSAATFVGISGGIGDMAFRLEGASVVPEPSSLIVWSLLGLALGAGWWRRRKRAA